MSSQYLSELRIFTYPQAPKGWTNCNGQLLAISQNQALFSLLGTTYGGNGVNNFQLPDLRGRNPMHLGGGFVQGQVGGEATHTLVQAEIPGHNHVMQGSSLNINANTANNNFLASNTGFAPYSGSQTGTMNAAELSTAGSSQPHALERFPEAPMPHPGLASTRTVGCPLSSCP